MLIPYANFYIEFCRTGLFYGGAPEWPFDAFKLHSAL